MTTCPPAIIRPGSRGAELSRSIAGCVGLAGRFAPARDVQAGETGFTDLTGLIRELFIEGRPIIVIAASAIVIRAVAPLLRNKLAEPPVIAVAEDGSSVVPLLGGHRGANVLARAISDLLKAHCAITTASDVVMGIALDEPPRGWRLAADAPVKTVASHLLGGGAVRLVSECAGSLWPGQGNLATLEHAPFEIITTHRRWPPLPSRLVYHPPVLALGVGASRGAEPVELERLLDEALKDHLLAPEAIALIATVDIKADEPAIDSLADWLKVPVRVFALDELRALEDLLVSPSSRVQDAIGIAGVCEASALLAAGTGAELIVSKRKSKGCTIALALAPQPLDPFEIGRARGRLSVVGIGPGERSSRTIAATRAILEADALVGYGLYIDLVEDLVVGQVVHRYPLGAEAERCKKALELASLGQEVALVCSGDPGVFAMASLVFELAREDRLFSRVPVAVLPGISAMQAASAHAGGMIGHDFCAISLSDLMTPADLIEARLEAAAQSGLVTALYNPVSRRRRSLLETAKALFVAAQGPDVPVVVARSLGREGETVRLMPLRELEVDDVDMMSIILIGNQTTIVDELLCGHARAFTPRGYVVP